MVNCSKLVLVMRGVLSSLCSKTPCAARCLSVAAAACFNHEAFVDFFYKLHIGGQLSMFPPARASGSLHKTHYIILAF